MECRWTNHKTGSPVAETKGKIPLGTPCTREGFYHKISGKAAEWSLCGFGKIEEDERIL